MKDDLISRQTAIDAVHKEFDECLVWDESGKHTADEVERVLTDLPSAQPEIIRCKDCVDWYPFSDKLFGYCRRQCWEDDGQYRLKVETYHDDYCSYGERRDG